MRDNKRAAIRSVIETAVRKTFDELGVEAFRATEFFSRRARPDG